MKKFETIYSLKAIHDLVKKYEEKGEKDKIIIFFDLDLTVIHDKGDGVDVLIEPKISKELFSYLYNNNIWFSFVTARFHDAVCVKRKREKIMNEIDENLLKIHKIFKELGLETDDFMNNNNTEVLYENGKCIGIIRKGIILSGKKGKALKSYMKMHNIENSRTPIFVDDFDRYLKSVSKEIPNSLIFRRSVNV